MCPNCSASFSDHRIDPNHISPRFDCCDNWTCFYKGEPYGGIFEAYAGEQGWIWALESSPCSCGKGLHSMVFFGGKVELFHPEHEVTLLADDGTPITYLCPRQHLGPYDKIPNVSLLIDALKEISSHVELSNNSSSE